MGSSSTGSPEWSVTSSGTAPSFTLATAKPSNTDCASAIVYACDAAFLLLPLPPPCTLHHQHTVLWCLAAPQERVAGPKASLQQQLALSHSSALAVDDGCDGGGQEGTWPKTLEFVKIIGMMSVWARKHKSNKRPSNIHQPTRIRLTHAQSCSKD